MSYSILGTMAAADSMNIYQSELSPPTSVLDPSALSGAISLKAASA
jgi:hypothetical protein